MDFRGTPYRFGSGLRVNVAEKRAGELADAVSFIASSRHSDEDDVEIPETLPNHAEFP